MRKRIFRSLLLLLLIPVLFVRCGGGSESPPDAYNPLWVSIDYTLLQRIGSGLLENRADLYGTAYCDNCPASVEGCTHLGDHYWADSAIDIAWFNHTTGATEKAYHGVYERCGWFFSYFTYYQHLWSAKVPLAEGDNAVEIRASNAAGLSSGETATIKHFPVTGLYTPEGIAVTYGNEIFVASASNSAIVVYSRTDNGQATPIRIISGLSTGLSYPRGIALDSYGNLLVQNDLSITVYPTWANGDVAPIRKISGASTRLAVPDGVAVDNSNGEIFVVNSALGGPSVTVFPLLASGDVAPIRRISGSLTGLDSPVDVGVDESSNVIFVVNRGKNTIAAFNRTADGDVAPVWDISGSSTGLSSPSGIAIDKINNEIFVVNGGNSSITVYTRSASGNVAPIRTISGSATGLSGPRHISVDTVNNEIFVTQGDATIMAYPRSASGNVAPIRVITSPTTGLAL